MKIKVQCNDRAVDVSDATLARITSPAWLRPFQFATHTSVEGGGFTLTEVVSGMAAVKNAKTRDEAISLGVNRLVSIGKSICVKGILVSQKRTIALRDYDAFVAKTKKYQSSHAL